MESVLFVCMYFISCEAEKQVETLETGAKATQVSIKVNILVRLEW